MQIESVVDVRTALGEGPLWDVDQRRLYFLDIPVGKVFRCTADGRELRAWDLPGKVGSMATIRQDGDGAIVALDSGSSALDFRTGDVTPICNLEPDLPTTRLNDGKVDRRGRFLAGSMDMAEQRPLGSRYRLDPDFKVTSWLGRSRPIRAALRRLVGRSGMPLELRHSAWKLSLAVRRVEADRISAWPAGGTRCDGIIQHRDELLPAERGIALAVDRRRLLVGLSGSDRRRPRRNGQGGHEERQRQEWFHASPTPCAVNGSAARAHRLLGNCANLQPLAASGV